MKNIFLLLSVFLIAGCGVNSVQAPQDKIVPLSIKSFAPQDYRLINNKFFLWKVGMTSEQGARALALSHAIDILDGRAVPLNRQQQELESQVNPLKDKIRSLNRYQRRIARNIRNTSGDIEDINDEMESMQQALQTEIARTPPVIEDLVRAAQTLGNAQGRKQALETANEDSTDLSENLTDDLNDLNAELSPLETQLTAVEAKQQEIEIAGRKKVEEITQVVDWYNNPPQSVAIQFADSGEVQITMLQWDLEDDKPARDFSTSAPRGKKPTIRNVSYKELGGVLKFEVVVYKDDAQTDIRETYNFQVSRTKYAAADGRIFFGGDLIKTIYLPDGSKVQRGGVATMVDRSN